MVLVGNQSENVFLSGDVHNINVLLLTWVFKKAIMQLLNIKWNTCNT